jgi:hypothetical protein
VARARVMHTAGNNDMAKGAARPARAKEICTAVRPGRVSGWIGTVETLSSNNDGKGVLSVRVGPDVHVKTWNNSLSDIGDNTLIEPGSPIFQQATALTVGQTVRFSGTFLRSDADCIREASMTLVGSISSPEFVFRFSEIEPINDR